MIKSDAGPTLEAGPGGESIRRTRPSRAPRHHHPIGPASARSPGRATAYGEEHARRGGAPVREDPRRITGPGAVTHEPTRPSLHAPEHFGLTRLGRVSEVPGGAPRSGVSRGSGILGGVLIRSCGCRVLRCRWHPRPWHEFVGLSGWLPWPSGRVSQGRGHLRLRCPGQSAGLRTGCRGLGGGSRGPGLRLARRASLGLGHHGDRDLVSAERAGARARDPRPVASRQLPDRPLRLPWVQRTAAGDRDGRFTGRVARHFDEYGKWDFALAQARELELAPRSCGAVGDSRSDLPLFASVGLSVAFNASPGAREAATAAVDDNDLRSVLPVLSHLVTATR